MNSTNSLKQPPVKGKKVGFEIGVPGFVPFLMKGENWIYGQFLKKIDF
jgi:hypothetical protein